MTTEMTTEEFLKQMYGLTTEELLDPTKIKILDGIAGSGKSSAMDAILHALGVNYYRTTPTHRLRRDAMERYGTEDVGTIQEHCSRQKTAFSIKSRKTYRPQLW